MSRWTGSWLSGATEAFPSADEPNWRGEHLGLPESGPRSAASPTIRLGALLIDLVLSSLCTSLFLPYDIGNPSAMTTFNLWAGVVWFVITVLGVSFVGVTPAMVLLGMRVVRMDSPGMVGPLRAIPRTVCVALIIPAAITDKNGRGLHDRLVGTIVIRTR